MMKYWVVAPLFVAMASVVGAQQTQQTTEAEVRKTVEVCPSEFGGLWSPSPLEAGRQITSREVPALRRFAFNRNRQQVFADAARIYGLIALSSAVAPLQPEGGVQGAAAASALSISQGQRWEVEALEAVNLSNLGRTEDAKAILNRLSRDEVGRAGLRPAQLALFQAINAAQGAADSAQKESETLDQALQYAAQIPELVKTANAAAAINSALAPDKVVAISVGDSELFNQTSDGPDLPASFVELLGKRPLTQVERAAIIVAQAAWVEARVYLIKAAKSTTASARDFAVSEAALALTKAKQAQNGVLETEALWLRAMIESASADLELMRNNTVAAVAAGEQAVFIVSRGLDRDANAAPIAASARRTLAEAYLRNGDVARARFQYGCAFNISAKTSALTQVSPDQVEPYLDVLFAPAQAGDVTAQAEFFRVATAASDGAAREVQAQLAAWANARFEDKPEVQEIFSKERELKSRRALLGSDALAQLDNKDPAKAGLMRQIAEMELDLRARRERSGFDPNVALTDSPDAAMKQLAKERGYSAVISTELGNASLSDVQGALRSEGDEVFLTYFVGERSIYGVAVSRSSARVFKVVGAPADIIADARAYTQRLKPYFDRVKQAYISLPLYGRGARPNALDTGVKLYQALMPEGVRELLAPARQLVVNSQGALSELPFSALLTRPLTDKENTAARASRPDGVQDYSSLPWLAKDKTISVALSAATFPLVRKLAPPSEGATEAIAFAATPDPGVSRAEKDVTALADVLFDRLTADWRRGKSQAAIAKCKAEITDVLNLKGYDELRRGAQSALKALNPNMDVDSALVEGSRFTDAALRQDLSRYRLIYFGAHGQIPNADSCLQDPFLVTSLPTLDEARKSDDEGGFDGLLTATEIFNFDLRNAELVVLAACSTGGVRQASAAGPTGQAVSVSEISRQEERRFGLDGRGVVGTLVQSFMVAGARGVLATHWEADKDATQSFMTAFFEAIGAGGVTYSEGMQKAQRAMIDDPKFSHPYFWASFVFVGDGQRAFK